MTILRPKFGSLAREQEETRVVPPVVLDRAPQGFGAVVLRRQSGSNRRDGGVAVLHDLFYAAGGVIEDLGTYPRVPLEEAKTLPQRNGMGDRPANPGKLRLRSRDQVVHNPNTRFGNDRELEFQKMIIVLMNRAGKGVFDRHNRVANLSVRQGAKNLFEAFTGQVG